MILRHTTAPGYIPSRIVSLVPSQTELLHYLGLHEETIGITKFCIHPKDWCQTKTKVGGTKTIKMDLVHKLQPDLIIANKEENVKEQVEELARHYPVWVTDVNNLEEALQMITDIGQLTGKQTAAVSLIHSIKEKFNGLTQLQTLNQKLRTAYLIWQNPCMTVGGDTFIHDMLTRCGFNNVFHDQTRYPETTIIELQSANLNLLLLSSEPYPFKQQHLNEFSAQLPGCKVLLVDGEYFSWYGSRLLQAPEYFMNLWKEYTGTESCKT